MVQLDPIVREFLLESHESLERLDRELLNLEQSPESSELLASLFRTLHNIKGSCGFLGFVHFEALAHAAEHLLGRLRDGALRLDKDRADVLLETADVMSEVLGRIELTGSEGAPDHADLIARLTALSKPAGNSAPTAPEQPLRLGDLLLADGAVAKSDIERALRAQREGDRRPLGEILVEQRAISSAEMENALDRQRSRVADSSVRVSVDRLDRLAALTVELGLARDQLQRLQAEVGGERLQGAAERLSAITAQLQDAVMELRLQTMGSVWDWFPRVVRDLCQDSGKRARIELEGSDVQLDKAIAEAIKAPLTHLVRNAIAHGIEPPDQRLLAGKEPEGRVQLRAFHQGGHLHIEVSDDGRGLDLERIREQGVARGLIAPEAAARISERDLAELIFTPGLSTAREVTSVSGRGVGMDVVKTHVERIGGRVQVQSQRGSGTRIRIRIPSRGR